MKHRKFACVFRPGFQSCVMAIGSSLCLFKNGLRPEMITGCSGGALAGAIIAPWDEETMRSALETSRNLTPGKISKLNWADDALLSSLITVPALHLLPPLAISERGKKIERGVRAGLSFILSVGSLMAVFRQPSFFSSAPLNKLLEASLNKNIFSDSAVKLAVIAAKQRDGERTIYTNFLDADKDRNKLIHGLLASSAIVPGLPPQKKYGEKEIDGIFASGDFLGIDLIERYTDVDNILLFRFYDLPLWQEPKDNLEEGDHANEITVRDRIDSILAELPDETKRKITPVMLDEPPRKIGLRDFTKADLRYLFEKGYQATKRFLQENKWI